MEKIILTLSLLFVYAAAHASWADESKKIEFLLHSIEISGATFIRNGEEYDAPAAVAHLRAKLKSAQSSWFAPSKEKWTAAMFITEIATKSSVSGKPYFIKDKGKEPVPAADWLNRQLSLFQ